MTEQQKNWRISIGIHRGTMTSRDNNLVYEHFDDPTKPLISLEECRETAKKWEESYHSMGYFIWFGTAISPDGEPTDVLQGAPYR